MRGLCFCSPSPYQALTAMIIESGALPAQQLWVPLPAVATRRNDEHDTGVNATLHPLVIAVPMQAFPTVLMEPTFVALQYTSQLPWHVVVLV